MHTGQLIRLREYRAEDTERALEFMNDPEVRRMLSDAYPYPYTLAEERKWVESQGSRGSGYNFAIETLADGKYIGGCGFNSVSERSRCAVLGVVIGDKDYWSKGYGTDVMKTLVRIGFNDMNLHRLELRVFEFNPRAIRCYEKAGFAHEGRSRERLFHDGRYWDELHMGILRSEWMP